MKNVLSIEQMLTLIDKGLNVGEASYIVIFFNEHGEELGWDVTNNGKDNPKYEWYDEDKEIWSSTRPQLFDAETGSYDHSYRKHCGVFDLSDILEILPKKICNDLTTISINHYECLGGWDLRYENIVDGIPPVVVTKDELLIQAAYQMLLWCIENGHIKTQTNE